MYKETRNNYRVVGGIEDRVNMLLAEYGEKAQNVLKAALARTRELDKTNLPTRLGDFDYKGLKKKLMDEGINYNPNLLLRIMEREYAIIETSYKSSTQHWWNFYDRETIEKIIEPKEEPKDPEALILKIQFASLEPYKLLKELENLIKKPHLDNIDKKVFKKIVFNDAEQLISLLNKMKERENIYKKEIETIRNILDTMDKIAEKILKEGENT